MEVRLNLFFKVLNRLGPSFEVDIVDVFGPEVVFELYYSNFSVVFSDSVPVSFAFIELSENKDHDDVSNRKKSYKNQNKDEKQKHGPGCLWIFPR